MSVNRIIRRMLLLPMALMLSGVVSFAQKATVSGFIFDAAGSEPLIAASISAEASGTASNNYGFYSLTLPLGDIVLEYGYIGYQSQQVSISLQRDTTINIRLVTDNELDAVTVVAKRETGISSTSLGAIDVPISQILATPTVLGQADILKTVQLLPGVQSGTNGFTGLFVRGGGPDENLLMLDGVAFYNADHLLGLFSVFMPEAVKKVTLYKGSFPARYGGRTSSVLDIRTNDGNAEETHGSVGISLLSSTVHVEGPVWKGKTSYSVSGRLMHTIFAQPILSRLDMDDKYNYWFYDLNAKITHRISDMDRLYLNIYNGQDHLMYDGNSSNDTTDTDILWGNTLASLRWNHVFGGKLFSNTTFAYNHYRMDTHSASTWEGRMLEGELVNEYTEVDYNSGIRDIDLMTDFDYSPSPDHLIRFGAGFIFHTFNPETIGARQRIDEGGVVVQDTTITQAGSTRLRGLEWSAYAEDDIAIGEHFAINPGVHFNVFHAQSKTYFSLQPRLSARYGFDNGLAFKAGYSRMAQNIHLLSSTQITLPIDLWVPVTDLIKPVVSNQYSAGAYYDGLEGWEFSLEGYYKAMDNVLEYRDGVVILGNSRDWQDKVVMGEGRAYGLELFVQKTAGNTTGWLSYTLAKSERRFPDGAISGGQWFPYKYDRRHQLHLVVNHKFNSRVDISGTWSFATGGVLTLPERETVVVSPDGQELHQADLVVSRGNYRLPPSHRLNIGVNFRKKKKHGERVWTLSVYNLYNQMSPDITMTTSNHRHSGSRIYENDIKLKYTTILPVLPSVGYSYRF